MQTADGWYVSVLKAAASLQKERSVGLAVIESCRKNLRQKMPLKREVSEGKSGVAVGGINTLSHRQVLLCHRVG